MPRSRIPVEMQTKHVTNFDRAKKQAEERSVIAGKNQLSKPPDWLINDIALEAWKRITRELKKIDLIGNLDVDNIAGYCNAFAHYREATEQLAGQSLVVLKQTNAGLVAVANPLIAVQKSYADEMRKFARLCGLTVDGRLKLASLRATKEENEVEGKFGAI